MSARRSISATRIGAPSNLQPEAEAVGMKFGDAVLAVNGRPIDGFFVYYGTLRQARAGRSPARAGAVARSGNTPSEICRSTCGRIAATPTRRSAFRRPSVSRCGSRPAGRMHRARLLGRGRAHRRSLGLAAARTAAEPCRSTSVRRHGPRGHVRTRRRPSAALRRLRRVLQPHRGAGAHALRDRVSGASAVRSPLSRGSNGSWPAISCSSPSLAAIAVGLWVHHLAVGAPADGPADPVPDRRRGRLRRRRQFPRPRRLCRVARMEGD